MKSIVSYLLILISIILLTQTGVAVTGNGQARSEFYLFEQDSVSHIRFYQAIQGKLSLYQYDIKSISFTTYTRWTTDFDNKYPNDPELFAYDAYFTFKNIIPRSSVGVGRQFLYTSAGSALIDGMSFGVSPCSKSNIKLFAGSNVSRLEPDKIQNFSDYLVVGGRLSRLLTKKATVSINWLRKTEASDVYYHRLSGDVRYRSGKMNWYGRVGFNPEMAEISELIARTAYRYNDWYLSGEYLWREPSVSLNSVFALIDYQSYQRIRLECQYTLQSRLKLFSQFRVSVYDDENVYAGTFGIRKASWSVAYTFTNGRGLESNGVTGSIAHKLNSSTSIYGTANVSRYKIQDEYDDLSDAYTTAFGAIRSFTNNWQAKAEWQYLRNAVESSSSRFYFTVSKGFSFK